MVAIGDLLKVTRVDIQDFPGDTIDLIMDLQKEGWRAQRSNRNHVMLFAPDGVTKYSASHNANSAKYLREDIARYKRGDKLDGVSEEDPEMKVEKLDDTEKFPCPHIDCNRTFISQDFLNVHIGVDHEGMLLCPHTGCFEMFIKPVALGRHRQAKHGYVSPKRTQRKKQEAKRRRDENTQKAVALGVPEDIAGIGSIFGMSAERQAEIIVKSPTVDEANQNIALTQHNSAPKGLSPEDVARQTEVNMSAFRASAKSAAVVRTEDDLEFIDSRDSWTVDHKNLGRRRIGDLEETFNAAGLKMEIRVWKEE